MILNDTTWTPFWQQMVWYDGIEYFRNQRVIGMAATLTDYTLTLNGTAIQPATDKVEADNNAPVSSAAVYTKLDEVNTTLNSKQDRLNHTMGGITIDGDTISAWGGYINYGNLPTDMAAAQPCNGWTYGPKYPMSAHKQLATYLSIPYTMRVSSIRLRISKGME